MRLYDSTVRDFCRESFNNEVADKLKFSYGNYYGKNPSNSEYNSWNNSLQILANVLNLSSLRDNMITIEYELPYTQKRIDVLIFGIDKNEQQNVVILELKQWSEDNIELSENEGNIIVDMGQRISEHPHPSMQVEGYYYHLKDFVSIFDESQIEISGLSYCHNYSGEKLLNHKFNSYLSRYPIYGKNDDPALIDFLNDKLSFGQGGDLFNRFAQSVYRPSKRLLDHTRDMINKQQVFNLIDEQITAYNSIMTQAKKVANGENKAVIIIKGGPGTGKSVIALEVMGQLIRNGKNVFHATGAKAFTETLRKILGPRLKPLFKFFNSFIDHYKWQKNSFDVLICDEAHRIRQHSIARWTASHLRTGKPQVYELIDVAKLSIFLIDDNQIVRPTEMGNSKSIRNAAIELGVHESDIYEYELETQFRCGGSNSYVEWVDNILHINNSDKEYLTQKDKFEIKILDTPHELKSIIDQKNQQNKNSARLVAGFCWPWSKPNPDGSLELDVKIGDFEMPWENKNDFWKWATDDSGMEQVGTVYTAQGFEYDYIGVIFGNDLIYDINQNQWQSVPENSKDTQVKSKNDNLTKHLQNVYRVLLTRAHKGVYVYFMDKNTEDYFKSKIKL